MAEEKKEVIEDVKKEEVKVGVKKEEVKEEFVSKKAYSEVASDMHKYKSELKDIKAKLNQLNAEKEAEKNEQLAEQGRWEELYKKQSEDMNRLKQEKSADQDKFIGFHKKNSVLQKVGGFKRDEYNKFINVDAINLNDDGSIDEVSMNLEIDRIRQTYPELLKTSASNKLPNNAPKESNIGGKTYESMTRDEKFEYKKNLLKKPTGF